MIQPSEALKIVMDRISPLGSENIPVISALRRYMAQVCVSARDIPFKDSSAMDGYAVRYSDPMSHSSLSVNEEQIQLGVMEISGLSTQNVTRIPELCAVLIRQIADRNSKVKILK